MEPSFCCDDFAEQELTETQYEQVRGRGRRSFGKYHDLPIYFGGWIVYIGVLCFLFFCHWLPVNVLYQNRA